jgi:Flp pilus assembly protein TadB
MERMKPTIMGQTGRKVEEVNYVQRNFVSAGKKQKLLWHIRWMLLCLVILMNVVGVMMNLSAHALIAVNGISLSLYFLLGQLEAYFDCKSNCTL